MEFAQGGELFFHLHREKNFDDEKNRFYIAEIILALNFVHKNKIIYRDIKPENILLDIDGHIKLTDFGLSKICSKSNEKAFTICGTPFYIAPEIIEKKGYNSSVDWWSLGCLMYEMIHGRPLFNFTEANIDIKKYDEKIPFYNNFSEEAKDLISKLVVKEPDKRLGAGPNGFEDLKSHKYFKEINWDDLENKKITPPFEPIVNGPTDLRYFDKIFTEEVNVSRESNESNSNDKTIDNYVNFSYYDPNNISFNKNKQNLGNKKDKK
jgi:serine/threonine protein kinase